MTSGDNGPQGTVLSVEAQIHSFNLKSRIYVFVLPHRRRSYGQVLTCYETLKIMEEKLDTAEQHA